MHMHHVRLAPRQAQELEAGSGEEEVGLSFVVAACGTDRYMRDGLARSDAANKEEH